MRWLTPSVSLLLFLGCTGDDPSSTPAGSDAGLGSADGAAAQCSTPARCSDDGSSLVTCGISERCGLGCDAERSRCRVLVPSGAVGSASSLAATATTTLAGGSTYWFDVSTGTIGLRDAEGTPTGTPVRAGGTGVVAGIGFDVVTQTDGSKIGAWAFRSLTIAKDAVVRVYGSDALALMALGDLVVDGTVNVHGDCAKNVAGPGAASASSTWNAKVGETKLSMPQGYKYICSGGGGGGNGTAGGDGGWASGTNSENTTFQSLGGARGAKRNKTLIDEPLLVGGGAGARGGYPNIGGDIVPNGGVGGGAVQLSASGTITIGGLVDAGGCGGKRGFGGQQPINTAYCRGAGGGGAGGTIFLEASAVRVTPTGRVLANGGGGGGGSTSYEPAQNADGASNSIDASRAAGGAADARRATSGSCAPGQKGNVPATELSADPCAAGDIAVSSSGGGGGAGSIAVRTADASLATDEGGIVNPPPARGVAAVR